MGWKSTISISREEATELIFRKLSQVHSLSNNELGDMLESMGFGEDTNLPYYGHNFRVQDKIEGDENNL